MIIIGHSNVNFKPFHKIRNFSDLQKTPPNSIVAFEFELENFKNLTDELTENKIKFAVLTKDKKEVVIAQNLGASFLITPKEIAPQAQKIADNYMYDAKILMIAKNDQDFDFAIENLIDGVIFDQGVIDGNL